VRRAPLRPHSKIVSTLVFGIKTIAQSRFGRRLGAARRSARATLETDAFRELIEK